VKVSPFSACFSTASHFKRRCISKLFFNF
jgi:hypothetical protein